MRKYNKFFDISIVISVTDYHWSHACQNVILTKRQNPDVNIQWILVANNHDPSFPIPESMIRNPSVQIVDGFPFSNFEKSPRPGSASLAAGMKRGFEYVQCRYVIQMDADFYAIRFKWISEALDLMRKRGLTFWGAPWDLKRKEKWRGFPCSHLTIMDTNKIPLDEIDFTAKYLPYFEYYEVPGILRNSLYVEFLQKDYNSRLKNIRTLKEELKKYKTKLQRRLNETDNGIPNLSDPVLRLST